LAHTQWIAGRLEERVLKRAIEIIDDGTDILRWETSKDIKKRQEVLEKLALKIQSPQPKEKKYKKRKKLILFWKIGDVLSYRLDSGKSIILRLIGSSRDRGGIYPLYQLYNWIGTEIPSIREIKKISSNLYVFR
jgi:hypothetical protein